MISARAGVSSPSSPLSSPNCEVNPERDGRYRGQVTVSVCRWMVRHTRKPKVTFCFPE